MEFLKIKELCKVYGKGENQVTALDHISLTIEKGEFTAIIGSSGSIAGLAIALLVLSLNMIGDGLRDALDPRMKN